MQDRKELSDSQINNELLWFVERAHPRFWIMLLITGGLLGAGILAFGWLVLWGLGVAGVNRPIMWGFFLVNFVFWVGISHAGVMISAILRLTRAEWRRPVTRAAEVLTVFALATAALHPIIHSGRPWRIYWVFPYDFDRGIWPNVRSPFVWDPSAIFTYLTGSSLFVYIALLPDLAVARDRARGWKKIGYSILSLGWRGTSRQWQMQGLVGILLSALILPVFVSVHSIVSWDFAVSLVPAWHATVFAPYFVIGAVHSGVSAVVTLMAMLRWLLRLQNVITEDHFDALGRLLVAVGTAWLYFFMLDVFFAIYSQEAKELAVMNLRVFTPPFSFLFILILVFGYFIPIPLWLFRQVRRNIPLMFFTSILVNIAMWSERFWLIIPGLAYKERFAFTWNIYVPTIVEITIVAGTFGLVGFGVLMFSKFFPIIPIWDEKEGQVLKDEVDVGRAKVPALMQE